MNRNSAARKDHGGSHKITDYKIYLTRVMVSDRFANIERVFLWH